MTISSRTPEGQPNRCSICGSQVCVEPSRPAGDAPCPSCGQLLWWFQERLAEHSGVSRDQITADTDVRAALAGDSLDLVELVMEFEEAFDIHVPDKEIAKIQTVRDAILFVESRRRKA